MLRVAYLRTWSLWHMRRVSLDEYNELHAFYAVSYDVMAAFGQKCFKNRWGIVSAVASVDVLSNDAETVGLYRDSITPSIRSRRHLWLWLSSATAIPLILYYSGTSPLLCSANYFRWSAGGIMVTALVFWCVWRQLCSSTVMFAFVEPL